MLSSSPDDGDGDDGYYRALPSSSSRPVLYALTNQEGLARQKGTLSCLLEVSRLLDRQLVLLPFHSHHFGYDGRSPIRLDDYVDSSSFSSSGGGGWRTAGPSDDLSVLGGERAGELCVIGHLNNAAGGRNGAFGRALFWSAAATKGAEDDGSALSIIPASVPEDLRREAAESETLRGGRTWPPDARELARRVRSKFGDDDGYACLVSQQTGACAAGGYLLDPSPEVRDLAREGLERAYNGGARGKPHPHRALHLRRGDRCSGGAWARGEESEAEKERIERTANVTLRYGPVRCGPAEAMPFLDLCRSDPDVDDEEAGGAPLYVATDETDEEFLRTVRAAGCLLSSDLGLELSNRGRSGAAGEAHRLALSYSVESYILKTAHEAYTFGCSTLALEMDAYRSHHRMRPVRLYRNETGSFEPMPHGLRKKVVEQACYV